jgi:hypothetical protein
MPRTKGGGFDTEPEISLPAPSGLLAGYSAAAGVATRRVRSLIVDVFPDEAGRQVHLEAGRASLMDGAPELFAEPPSIGTPTSSRPRFS